VTVLVSSDKQDGHVKADAKAAETKPAVSRRAKRGGAAAAPRTKRAAKPEAEAVSESSAPEKKPQKKSSKAGSKLGSALRRKKKEE
jgi:hypothetical protein